MKTKIISLLVACLPAIAMGHSVRPKGLVEHGLYGKLIYSGAASCDWTNANGSWSDFSANGSCTAPAVTKFATAPPTLIPGVTFPYLPAGDYQVSVTGLFSAPLSTNCGYRISDGTNTTGWSFVTGSPGFNTTSTLIGSVSYGSDQTNVTFQLQSMVSGGAGSCEIYLDNGTVEQLEWTLIKL